MVWISQFGLHDSCRSSVPIISAAPSIVLLTFLAVASAAIAQTPLCDSLAAADSPGEVAASPRDSRDAELLSLMVSRGVAADSSIYGVVEEDLDLLMSLRPELADLPIRSEFRANSLWLVFVSPEARDVAQEGELEDFECLNEVVDLESATYYNILPRHIHLSFDGLYRVENVAPSYEQVPGVESSHLSHSWPDRAGCFYRREDGVRVYFFEEWFAVVLASTPILLVRAEVDGSGGVEFADATPPYEPALEEEYEACLAGLLDVPNAVEIPTLSRPALALLALLVAFAGLAFSKSTAIGGATH